MADTVRVEIAVEAVDNTGQAIDKIVNSLQKLKTAAGNSQDSLGKASEQVTQFDKQAQKTQKTLQSWAKQKWKVAIEAIDKVSPLLSTVKNGLSGFAGKTWNVTLKAIDLVTSPVKGILNLLQNPILQAGAVLGVTIGLTDTIDTYKDFEATMSKVKAISGATTSEMERLTAKAQEMGETTKFTATEAGDAFTYMAMAGWDSQQMLNGIEGIMNLAAADGLDLATTSDIVTDALTAFHLQASDAAHFADVLAKASSSANTNVSMLGNSFKYVGSVAGAFGYSIEDTAIALATMANAGVKGDMGGTALRGALTSLISPSENAAQVMSKYGLSMEGANGQTKTLMEVMEMLRAKFSGLNVSLFDGEGELKDYETILEEMSGATGSTSASVETLSDLATLFSARALPGMLALIQSGTEDFYALSDAIYHADGTASDMSETMLDNLAGSLTILQSAAEGVKLSVGERLAPYIRQFAEWLTSMMPFIKQGLNEGIDWIEGKIEELKNKIRDVTGSVQFQDANFFGKVEILWDEIIATPFRDWWESKGHRMIADTAGNAAQWIGEGIKAGLLALLGIQMDSDSDKANAKDAGVSIAASFMNGLKEGLNSGGSGIGPVVSSIFGNMLSSVGKILPGGAAPGLDTLVSAIALSKIASPVLAAGRGISSIGQAVMTPTGSDGTSLASWILGSGATGRGILGVGAKAATAMGAGDPLIGTSLSSGAMSAVGLGSIAGGLIGGFSLLNGVKDLYTGFTSEDQEKAAAYKKAGSREVLGVGAGAGAGAALGATIGAGFFGIGAVPGALIGAGIGGIAGMVSGNKAKKEYEEQAQAAQKAAEVQALAQQVIQTKSEMTGQSIQNITFKSRELNEAFRDTETSADTFYTMFREAVNEKVTSSFGNITLSLQEIRDMADSIVFDEAIDGVEKFQNSVSQAQKKFASTQTDLAALEKLNWKASLGFDFTNADLSDYQAQVDAFVRDAQNYVTDKHYEATLALKLLTNGEGDTSGIDSVYGAISEELKSKNAELQAKVQAALKDGVISTEPVTLPDGTIQLSEMEEITNLQNQISEIMNRVSAAEESAKLDALKIQYGGANLDAASFRQLQSELASSVEEMTSGYKDALTISLTNLHLQFPDEGEEFDAARAQLEAEFNERMKEINLRVENFQLDTIVSSFSADFDAVWPELAGSVEEMSARLKTAMETALAIEPDPIQWTVEQVTGWFGLSGMDTEAQAAIAEMLAGVAQTIPEAVKAQFASIDLASEVAEATSEAMGAVEDIDVSGVLDAIPENTAEAARNLDMSETSGIVGDKVMETVNAGLESLDGTEIQMSALEDAVESGVTDALGAVDVQAGADALNETLSNVDISAGVEALAANAETSITDTIGALDMSTANDALMTTVGSGFTEAMGTINFAEGTDVLTTGITASVTEAMNGLDFSAASEAIRVILSAAIAAGISGTDLSAAFAALAALRQQLEAQAKATLGAQMEIQIPINLTYNYNVTNPTPPKPTITAQTVSAPVNVSGRANGGFTSGAELSWVGEDGPEVIIPLGAKRRGRGLELYRQAGEILGVAKNAEGGIYNSSVYGGTAYNRSVYGGPVYGGSRYENENSSVSSSTADTALTNQLTDTSIAYITQGEQSAAAGSADDGLKVFRSPITTTAYTAYNARNAQIAETAHNTQINPASAYSAVNSAFYGGSRYRGGDVYHSENDVLLPVPANKIYDAETQVSSLAKTSTAYDVRNAHVSADSTENSFVYGGLRYTGGNVYGTVNHALLSSSSNDAHIYGGNSYRTAGYSSFLSAMNTYQTGVRNAEENSFADTFTAYSTRNSQTAAYHSANSADNRRFNGGVTMYANGGFTRGAELSWIGEDGPEAIIPLGTKRRERGLELYKQVGEILGVAKNAEGGVYGVAPVSNSANYTDITNRNVYSSSAQSTGSPAVQYAGTNVRTAYDTQNSTVTVRDLQNLQNTASSVYQISAGTSREGNRVYGGNSYWMDSAVLSPEFAAAYDMSRSAASYNYQAGANTRTTNDTRNSLTAIQNSLTSLHPETLTAYAVQNSPLSAINSDTSLSRSILNSPTDIRGVSSSYTTDIRQDGDVSAYNAYNADSLFRLPEETAVSSALGGSDGASSDGVPWYPGSEEDGGGAGETGFLPVSEGAAGGTSDTGGNSLPFNINVTINPQFSFGDIGNKSESEIRSFILRCMADSMDDYFGEFGERLISVWANMPKG